MRALVVASIAAAAVVISVSAMAQIFWLGGPASVCGPATYAGPSQPCGVSSGGTPSFLTYNTNGVMLLNPIGQQLRCNDC